MRRSLVSIAVAAVGILGFAGLSAGRPEPAPPSPPPASPGPSSADAGARVLAIEGRVTDAATGAALRGVQVFVVGTESGALTDRGGRYALALPSSRAGSEVTVRARRIGYVSAEKRLRVGVDGARADFALRPARLGLDEAVVAGEAKLRAAPSAAAIGTVPRAAQALPGRYDPDFHTESYARIEENAWLAPDRHPLSTFSIDVDRASYSNVRRFIREGVRPPVDAVRIEEMVNYFPYDYAEPRGEHPFAVTTEVATAPWRPEHRLVRIGIQGRRVDLASAPASNLVFLVDVSGSMRPADKLPLLKRSLRMLVDELRPEDRVAIVVYAGAAGLVLESTPGDEEERILDALERLEAGGSTAGGAGLRLAYDVAARNHVDGGNNRVILATDGDFNIGPSSDAEMIRLIEEKREQGTFLTVLGFGTGNLKDSKMEGLADHGNGNYAYIDGLLEARKVLVSEMGGTLLTIAKDVKIQVEFNPARVQAYRLIGYENRLLAAEDFNDDAKDAGELGAGHSVTALYEVVPVGAPPVETGSVDPLRYERPEGGGREEGDAVAEAGGFGEASDELLFVKLRYKRPDGDRSRLIEHPVADRPTEASVDLRFASAVAGFGMILRNSEQCGDLTLEDVSRIARGALGEDRGGYRAEFVRLVESTREMELLASR